MAIECDGWNPGAPDTITIIGGVNIDEGMLINLINNAIRRVCAAIAEFRGQAYCKDKHVTIQASGGAFPAAPTDGDWFLEY